jgi:riboflavin kinase / FMN adenylyltransferase
MIQLNINQLPQPELEKTVVTIGNFDGVHAGHQELIAKVVAEARQSNTKSMVITFDPHPAQFFQPVNTPGSIISMEFKQQLIAELGVDYMLILNFDEWLARLTPEEYVKEILIQKLNTRIIWIGYDFTFGRNRKGNVRLLVELGEKYGFKTNVLSPLRIADTVVSSTKIREFIMNGQVDIAAQLMKRTHFLTGKVIPGDQLGRELGFPTININNYEGLIPKAGIYSGFALFDKHEFPAAIYIGQRPTLQGKEFRIEAFLLNFTGDLYGKEIKLAFLKFQRNDIKFNNLDELKLAIEQDVIHVQQDYNEYKKINKLISFSN